MLRRWLPLMTALAMIGCEGADPVKDLSIGGVDTYWVLDAPVGQTLYLAPAVRFELKNLTTRALNSIQATAVFKRVGETETWGTDWQQISTSSKKLLPGSSVVVTLRSDGRYFSSGVPERMFTHADFKDAQAEVFVRAGSSGWVKMDLTGKGPAPIPIERRIGAKTVQDLR